MAVTQRALTQATRNQDMNKVYFLKIRLFSPAWFFQKELWNYGHSSKGTEYDWEPYVSLYIHVRELLGKGKFIITWLLQNLRLFISRLSPEWAFNTSAFHKTLGTFISRCNLPVTLQGRQICLQVCSHFHTVLKSFLWYPSHRVRDFPPPTPYHQCTLNAPGHEICQNQLISGEVMGDSLQKNLRPHPLQLALQFHHVSSHSKPLHYQQK